MKKLIIINLSFLHVIFSGLVYAYDNIDTHPRISQEAANRSHLNDFLPNCLGIDNYKQKLTINKGYEVDKDQIEKGRTKNILNWLRQGSNYEDKPMCRASNHFHDPLKESWSKGNLTDPNLPSEGKCVWWPLSDYKDSYSALVWASGFADNNGATSEVNSNINEDNGRNWSVARQQYYAALTATSDQERQAYLATTFETVGYLLHLLHDMSVPAHVRNDFSQGHWEIIGMPEPHVKGYNLFTDWLGNGYEGYVRDNMPIGSGNPEETVLFNGTKTITNFWDTDKLAAQSEPNTSDELGLAEYTNKNFVSSYTIFSTEQQHSYTYPNQNNLTLGGDTDWKTGYPDNLNWYQYSKIEALEELLENPPDRKDDPRLNSGRVANAS